MGGDPLDAAPLDPAKTAAFDLGRGPNAVLLFHGFTGSPWDVRPLGEALAVDGFRARGIRLPGHGTTPGALREVRAADWLLAAEEALAGCPEPRVAVAGLSMGALLGLVLAARHPERISALVLMAPAVRFRGHLLAGLRMLRHVPLLEWTHPWVRKSGTDVLDPAARAEAPVLQAFPSARLRDLWQLQDVAWEAAPRVTAPILLAVAREDHVVERSGAVALARRATLARSLRFIELANSAHIIPRDGAAPLMIAETLDFLRRVARGADAPGPVPRGRAAR